MIAGETIIGNSKRIKLLNHRSPDDALDLYCSYAAGVHQISTPARGEDFKAESNQIFYLRLPRSRHRAIMPEFQACAPLAINISNIYINVVCYCAR